MYQALSAININIHGKHELTEEVRMSNVIQAY